MQLPVATIDASFEINYLSVGAMADPLDDFYGAVGRGTLKLAASGMVTNGSDGRPLAMQVSALGVYLRDTYDFVGDQFLGLWSEMGVDRSRADEFLGWKTSIFSPIAVDKGEYDGAVARDSAAAGQPVVSPLGGVLMPSRTAAQDVEAEKRQWHSVSNADFVRYRMKAGKGHDYVNVSDVRITRLPCQLRSRSERRGNGTMKQQRKARFLAVGIAVATGLGLVTAYALGGSGRRLARVVSPDRTYRIDWVTPDRLERWLHDDMSTASRIALHNNVTGRLVGVSEVVDMDAGGNGQPVWLMKDMGMVSVGPGAQFLHVPPLAPDGHPLPIDKDFSGTTHAEDRPEPKQR